MRAIITFQGFRESARNRSGTEDLYWRVIKNFANDSVTTAWPQNWNADVKYTVDQIARQGIRHVALVSYSHGQAAATAFAREAYERGIDIDLWLACDPVYRPTWLPRWNWLQPFAFRAMLKTGKIVVPKNIRRVVYVRQETTRPCGHTLVPSSPNTYVQKPAVLPYSHTMIDEATAWHELVKHELRHWLNPPKAEPV
jgi:hypothetical protein